MNKENHKKLSQQRIFSIVLLSLGVLLLVFMIVVEDEPGGIPLLLILSGTIWYFITRFRIRSQKS